eukprot:2864640-Pleurochrysis_carterae.AAC.1
MSVSGHSLNTYASSPCERCANSLEDGLGVMWPLCVPCLRASSLAFITCCPPGEESRARRCTVTTPSLSDLSSDLDHRVESFHPPLHTASDRAPPY